MTDGHTGPTGWAPTHRVPDGGLAAWTTPDPSHPADYTLPAGTSVTIASEASGWARVTIENGWSGWVAAAGLVPLAGAAPAVVAAPSNPPTGPPSGPPTGPLTAEGAPQGGGGLSGFLAGIEKPGNGLLLGFVAVVACIVTSIVLWPVLQIPGNALRELLPEGNCINEQPKTFGMYLCSARIGLFRVLGGAISLVIVLLLRRPIETQLRKLFPKGRSALAAPMMGTAMFSLVYSSAHADTANADGLVPQRIFPAVVGILLLLGTRLGPAMSKKFPGAITKRDRIPAVIRLVLVVVVPLLLAYTTMNEERVTDTARKEQVVVLATMLFGYVSFLPRNGDLVGAARRVFGLIGRRLGALRQKQKGSQPTPGGSPP